MPGTQPGSSAASDAPKYPDFLLADARVSGVRGAKKEKEKHDDRDGASSSSSSRDGRGAKVPSKL